MRLPHDCKLTVQNYLHANGWRPVPYDMITVFSKELDRGFTAFVRTQPVLPVSLTPFLYPFLVRLRRRIAILRLIRLVKGLKVQRDRIGS